MTSGLEFVKIPLEFRRTISPPSSGSKINSSHKPNEVLFDPDFLLVNLLMAYSSNLKLKTKTIFSSESSL
jgi:hypothetical protein